MRRACLIIATFALPAAAQEPTFAKDIVPVFEKYCIGCHTSSVKLGSLDLSTFEGLQKGGNHGQIVVPGKPSESRLYTMVAGLAKPSMPMDGSKLAQGELDVLKRWIEAGAKGPAPGEQVLIKSGAQAPKIEPKVAVKPQIFSMAWRPGAAQIALGGFREVRLHDVATNKASATLGGHQEIVRGVAFSRDGKLLAAAGGIPGKEGEVKVWNVDQRAAAVSFKGHSDCIYAVAFSPDAKLIATSSYDKLIKLWDAASGKEVRTLKDHIDAVYALTFTPDGKRLISGAADRTVKIWDVATGERLYTLSEPSDGINSIAVDPTGKLVAAGGLDKTIRIWSLGDRAGNIENSQIAHEDAILKIAFSPDGKRLVTSSADKTIKMFSVPDLAEVKSFGSQPDWVYGIEFAPDGKSFAAGRYDGSLALFQTEDNRTASR